MGIDAGDAEEQFVADGLADDGRTGGEDFCDRGRMGLRRGMGGEPGRIAGAGARARDVVHVLDASGQPGERPGPAAHDRRFEIVRNEECAAPVGLRPCGARDGWERDSTRCQMQKSTAFNLHGGPS
jgi:hypothetical protein